MILSLKKFVNTIFSLFGIRLSKVGEEYVHPQKHAALIEEFQACFNEVVVPETVARDSKRTQLLSGLLGTGVNQAFYILAYLRKTMPLAGDVCEFGIAQGATSALLANEIRSSEKCLWLFDSFQGLSRPTEKDILINDILNLGDIKKYEGQMSCEVKQVESRLKAISFPFSRVQIVPGFIEDTVKLARLPATVCFAYVDFDLYSPILTALNFLEKHLSPGGYIVIHDYGHFSSGVQTAVHEFLDLHQGKYELLLPRKFAGAFCIIHKAV